MNVFDNMNMQMRKQKHQNPDEQNMEITINKNPNEKNKINMKTEIHMIEWDKHMETMIKKTQMKKPLWQWTYNDNFHCKNVNEMTEKYIISLCSARGCNSFIHVIFLDLPSVAVAAICQSACSTQPNASHIHTAIKVDEAVSEEIRLHSRPFSLYSG